MQATRRSGSQQTNNKHRSSCHLPVCTLIWFVIAFMLAGVSTCVHGSPPFQVQPLVPVEPNALKSCAQIGGAVEGSW